MSNTVLPEFVALRQKAIEREKELNKKGTTKGKFFIQ